MSTTTASETVVVMNPLVLVLPSIEGVDKMVPLLEEPEHEEDQAIIAAFEDLPVAEPRDYAEVELEEGEECECDECIYGEYYDDRDTEYYSDGPGDWYWNDGGGYADW